MEDSPTYIAPTVHELKSDADLFDDVQAGRMTCQIRFDDRGYKVGDILMLRKTRHTAAEMKEGAPLLYVGPAVARTISHILRGPIYGLVEGWAILSFDTRESTLSPRAASPFPEGPSTTSPAPVEPTSTGGPVGAAFDLESDAPLPQCSEAPGNGETCESCQ